MNDTAADHTIDLARLRHYCNDGTARNTRQTARVSLAEIASAAAVPKSTLYRWERGANRPHGPAALRYLAILDQLTNNR